MATQFGNYVEHYALGRQPYADVVMECCKRIGCFEPHCVCLDLGCGTGISSRQLAELGPVIIGCDSDEAMVRKARSEKPLVYVQSKAEHLPFSCDVFDGAACFGSFHWFSTSTALAEIWRVLKSGGPMVVVNKWDTGSFYCDLERILDPYQSIKPERAKTKSKPFAQLDEHGFHTVMQYSTRSIERFSIEVLLHQVQSMNPWHHVPRSSQDAALREVEAHFRAQLTDDVYIRMLQNEIVVGFKL